MPHNSADENAPQDPERRRAFRKILAAALGASAVGGAGAVAGSGKPPSSAAAKEESEPAQAQSARPETVQQKYRKEKLGRKGPTVNAGIKPPPVNVGISIPDGVKKAAIAGTALLLSALALADDEEDDNETATDADDGADAPLDSADIEMFDIGETVTMDGHTLVFEDTDSVRIDGALYEINGGNVTRVS